MGLTIVPIRQLLTASNIYPTCWLVYIGRSREFRLLFQSDAGSTVWNVGEGCDESRDCDHGSSVKPGDAINDDDEPFEAKLSRNDVKEREMSLLQTRDYMFAQGTGISLSSLVKIPPENSHRTAVGLRKITLGGNL